MTVVRTRLAGPDKRDLLLMVRKVRQEPGGWDTHGTGSISLWGRSCGEPVEEVL